MFTFLKNKFISSIAVATVGGAEAGGETALRHPHQKQHHFTADSVYSNHHLSLPPYSYHSSTPTVGPNLMDEAYFLRKFEEYEKNDNWDYVFQRINLESETQAKKLSLGCDLSNSYHEKNRYRNVLPYDQNRITLKSVSENDSYINASPLHLPFARRNYILTQGPLPNTASDFWQMVFEQKVSICIMLSKVMEKSFIKCHSYFPCKEAPKLKFEHFECELEHEEIKPNFIIRRIRLTPLDSFRRIDQQQDSADKEQSDSAQKTPLTSRTIHHFQFTTWPDFGVPEHTDHFLEFLEEVRSAREKLLLEQEDDSKLAASPPVVCHCSAGIGRTGTFVIVDSVVSMISKKRAALKQQQERTTPTETPESLNNNNSIEAKDKKVEEQLESFEALVIYIRRHRMGLIQTSQQLRFSWKTIVDWIRKGENNGKTDCDDRKQPSSPPAEAAVACNSNSSSPKNSQQKKQQQQEGAQQQQQSSATLTDIRWCNSVGGLEGRQQSQSPDSSSGAALPTVAATSTVVPYSSSSTIPSPTPSAASAAASPPPLVSSPTPAANGPSSPH